MRPPEITGKQTPPAGRAFELDALRGLALLMMILHHLIFDLRYLFNQDVFAFQEQKWFIYLLRPVFLAVFIIVSGISSTFSRSNTRRGLRLAAVAVGLTIASLILTALTPVDFYILFNVLHVLAVGILLYALLTAGERRDGRTRPWIDVVLLLLSATLFWLATLLPLWPEDWISVWTLPFGLLPEALRGSADYLPLLPWLAVFLIGVVIGRVAYGGRGTALPGAPDWLPGLTRPLQWLGRHSLIVYILHQPVLLAILFALAAVGLL